MTLPDGYRIDDLRGDELPAVAEWAIAEGWNPGVHDIQIAWDLQPEAFLALRRGDDLVGVGTIFVHGPAYGFMGLFIVDPGMRGRGLGARLWAHRRDLLRARLAPGATIGMDGVFAMVPFYERGGFILAYRDLRMEGIAAGAIDPSVVTLDGTFEERIEACDRATFPVPRREFLQQWTSRPGVVTRGLVVDGSVTAYGVARPCVVGYKLGPVVARSSDDATRVLSDLMAAVEGRQVQLDVPEVNAEALSIARSFGLTESFGCARMYLGPVPDVEVAATYGVTSFEFG